MRKLAAVMLTLGALAAVTVAADPTIKEIMTKAHKGGDSLLASIEGQVKGDKPDWDAINKSTDQLIELGKSLAKNDPPAGVKGNKEGWKKVTTMYQDNVAALDAAAGKKDKEATAAAAKKIRDSCGACHGEFKPK